MSHGPADTWLVAALGGAERVALLGPGWDAVAAALVHQGVAVVADRPVDGVDVGVLAADAAVAPQDAVGVSPWRADDLARAVAATDGVVVTRLDVAVPVDAGGLTRPWPLRHRADVLVDETWVGHWDRCDQDVLDLPRRLADALAAAAAGLRARADAAVAARDHAARSSAADRSRAGSAEARARTTATLTDRWMATHEALQADGRPDPDAGPEEAAVAPAPDGGVRGLLRALGRSGRPGTSEVAPAPAAAPVDTGGLPGPGWRVAVVGEVARAWLGGWVHAVALEPVALSAEALVEAVDGHLDVLAIGPVEHGRQAAVASLADQAQRVGATVVGVIDGGLPWPGFVDLCDVVVTSDPDRAGPRQVAVAAPVDPRVVNPVGFRSRAEGLVTPVTGAARDLADVREALARLQVDSEPIGSGCDRGFGPDVAARAAGLRRTRGVVDVPAAHTSHAEHARTLVGLAAAGVPVVAPALPDAVADLLGPTLARQLAGARLAELDDPHAREHLSVRQRRAALWDHTIEARWRRLAPALDLVAPTRPPVSVVVVTNRPGHLAHCAGELARQSYRPMEVVLGVHGSHFTRADVDAFVATTGVPTRVVAVDGHRTLGEGLTQACRAASGELVVKWDDDDFYGPDHVVDLVQALDYSGATIVGKGSEFVHLGQLDITIRRFVGNAETGSRSLAGGTLALRREHLAAAGWWRRVPRGVDQSLLDDVERLGGRIHRTHGFGFTLARRAEGHTWTVDLDYFLGQSQAQWRGLARDAAGLDDRVLP